MNVASTFVCSTPLDGIVFAEGADGRVLDRSSEILEEIKRRCGEDVGSLFARPTFKETDATTVATWYAIPEGSPRKLSEFDDLAQRPLLQIIRSRLQRLTAVITECDLGSYVAAALNIRSFEDIYVIGKDPVIVNWGLLPEAVASSEIAREAHFRSTLGRAFPDLPTPPFNFQESATFGTALRQQFPKETSHERVLRESKSDVPNSSTARESSAATSDSAQPQSRQGWVTPSIAIAASSFLLLILLIPHVLERTPTLAPDQKKVERQAGVLEEINRSLEQQIRDLRQRSSGLVCRATPGTPGSATLPPGLLPPAAKDVPIRPKEIGGPSNAAALLEQAVVLVRSPLGTGSGFFISDHLLITNDHVVAGKDGEDVSSITIENRSLGKRVPVTILARTHRPKNDKDNLDFALLQAPANTSRASLTLASEPAKTTAVRAVGYPGILVSNTTASIPELSIVDGNVQSFTEVDGTMKRVLVHTARIFPGNSGGPLVDLCSRVVGVNTQVLTGRLAEVFEAQTATSLLEFLTSSNHQSATLAEGACAPAGLAFGGPASANGK